MSPISGSDGSNDVFASASSEVCVSTGVLGTSVLGLGLPGAYLDSNGRGSVGGSGESHVSSTSAHAATPSGASREPDSTQTGEVEREDEEAKVSTGCFL